ncbi:MAG: RNA 2',3'-cyclic phosphodiesterase [Anaerolineae bacterium]|nr:RNA 2',3'-cyclic phosphodiesterase [Anaerolineae bacterium]
MPEMLRTFVALPLSTETVEQLAQVQRTLKRDCPPSAVTWVAPTSIHLTLFFLGEILPELVAPSQEALNVVARHVAPFTFDVGHLGAFPSIQRPSAIWVGVQEPTGKLVLLHQVVNEALSKVGFQPETRKFSPHLTLGRVRRKATREESAAVGRAIAAMKVEHLATTPATEIIFFRSQLKPTGAEYTPLAKFGLVDGRQ